METPAARSDDNPTPRSRFFFRCLAVCAVFFMVALRVVALRSDAYARLSWSSALLTDEGFYLHNARNLVLFGHARTDAFNNRLIMPLLHALQVLLFRSVGVGTLPARALSVACSLLLLGLWADALRRAYGRRVAAVGTLLLGLDHVMLLYNRLALMDTPATLLVGGAYWAWVRGGASEGGRSGGWYGVCGALLGAGYGVRGLVAVVWVGALGSAWWVGRGSGRGAWVGVVGGLGLWVGGYALLWWLPHHAEIARVNRYYIQVQLLPHSLRQLVGNIRLELFNWQRGLLPFLIKHAPIQTVLIVCWFLTGYADLRRARLLRDAEGVVSPLCGAPQEPSVSRHSDVFLGLWLLIFLVFLLTVNYAPSRYYVMLYPPLAGIAALELERMFRSLQRATRLPLLLLSLWAVINTVWLTDWLTHLSYRQRDADRWLAVHLPVNSVLFGAVAPGLCMDNRFVTVPVIQDLCNDDHPIERYASNPRYILILDDRWKERWWASHYPALIVPANRIHVFNGLLRPFFHIGLYQVPQPPR